MSAREPSSAGAALLLGGIAGGLLGALHCCCWFGPAVGAWFAVRQLRAARGGYLPAGSGAALGLLSGGISAALVCTLGTAIFLALMEPGAVEESRSLLSGMGIDAQADLPQSAWALVYAMMGLLACGISGVIGGVMASGGVPGLPAPSADPGARTDWQPLGGRTPAMESLRPRGWTPVSGLPAEKAQAAEPADSPPPPDLEPVAADRAAPDVEAGAWTGEGESGVGGAGTRSLDDDPAEEEPTDPGQGRG